MMGDHGLMLKHGFAYESLIRVPFIWSEPDGSVAGGIGGRTGLLSGSIDIGATVLGRIGLAPPNGNRGFDLLPAAAAGAPVRDAILIEEEDLPVNSNVDRYLRLRTMVTGRWRLTFWDGDPLGRTVRPRGGSARGAQPVERSGIAGHQGEPARTHAARDPPPSGYGPESGLVRVRGPGEPTLPPACEDISARRLQTGFGKGDCAVLYPLP